MSADSDGTLECKECPTEGVACDQPGTTIQNLHIQPNFWRYSLTTSEVFECDHPNACNGSYATGNGSDNNYGNGLCAENYVGVLCG